MDQFVYIFLLFNNEIIPEEFGVIADFPTIVTFVFYIVAMLIVGWLGYRATHNLSDYILGGRRLGSVVTALSAGASDMSGWLLMGLPGAIYFSGLSGAWVAIGLCLGAWANWGIVARRLRIYTERCGNAQTLPDYFANRFHDQHSLLRTLTAVVILVFFTIYCGSGIVAGARLFESLFGLPYHTAIWIGAFATIAYVFIGGFLAVSWTDTIQASLMLIALVMVPAIVFVHLGDVMSSWDTLPTMELSYLDLFSNLNGVAVVSMLAWGLGYFGQPHILVRFMAAESPHKIPQARRIGMTWMILCLAGAILVGLLGRLYFAAYPIHAASVAHNAETVFIVLTRELFNPWLAGVFLAAILSAVMSTLSCQLLVCSSALTEDIYKSLLRRDASQRELVWVGRAMVLLVSCVAIVLAWHPESGVLHMVSYAWAGFGAAFGPVVLISLLWPRMTRNGALAGITVGALTVLVWKQFNWFQLYEIVPGFVFASFAIIVASLMDKPLSQSKQVFAEVAQALNKV